MDYRETLYVIEAKISKLAHKNIWQFEPDVIEFLVICDHVLKIAGRIIIRSVFYHYYALNPASEQNWYAPKIL